MRISMSCSAVVLVALLLIMASYRSCKATDDDRCCSSCGNHKVSHPFRLKEDAEECGDRWYNLSCEHNQLILHWKSGRYKVLSINYENYTIRVRDANIVESNYSSLPRDSLTPYNFSLYDPYAIFQRHFPFFGFPFASQLSTIMIYVRCKHAVNSSVLVNTAPCVEASNGSSGTSSSLYNLSVNVGSQSLRDLELEDDCCIEGMYMTSWPDAKEGAINSCTDIHNMLVYGFELSWLNSFCHKLGRSTHLDPLNKPRCLRYSSSILLLIAASACNVVICIAYLHVAKCVLCSPFAILFLIYKWRRRHLSMYDNIEDFLHSGNNIMPVRYSYRDIKKVTEGFKIKLGKGGYGSVYRAKLRSGRLAAVKMLDNAKANNQEFINEVATLGRIHHVNVVQLIGYCVEGSKRALIYEFMQNGSLDKYIYSQQENELSLDYEKLFAISLKVARGIEYLHKGCNMQILHFDIKPHNILLDEDFNPKVSDFGLAKLYPTKDNIVSLTAPRGTIGYMAPELFYRNVGRVSYKADVYSFGMLLMEMAGRRKNLNALAEHSSQLYFPFWVYDRLCEGEEINIANDTIEDMKLVKKMMIVALWCIQTNPKNRPSMNKIVEMLEGDKEDLEMPQKPYLYPQDLPAIDIKDHTSSVMLSSDPSGSSFEDSVSLLSQENICFV